MNKYKFFWINTDCPLSKIDSSLIDRAFNKDSGFGFEKIYSEENDVLDYSFTKEIKSIEEHIDPYGESYHYEITRYIEIKFSLIESSEDGKLLLIIDSPPRSIKPLKDALSSTLENNFYIDYLEIDLIRFMDLISQKGVLKTRKIKKVRASGINLGNSSIGSFTISSNKDALSTFNDRFGYSWEKLDQIHFSIAIEDEETVFIISSSGNLNTNIEISRLTLEHLLESTISHGK